MTQTSAPDTVRRDSALNDMKGLYPSLADTGDHLARAAVYGRLAGLADEAARCAGTSVLPAMESGGSTMRAQAYADSARYLRLLAFGERHFGRHTRGTAPLQGFPPVERELWEAYLQSDDRLYRAELLIQLTEVTGQRAGFEGAAEISRAVTAEREAAGFFVA